MSEGKEKQYPLDEVDGNHLTRVLKGDGSVQYLITSPGDDPALRITAKGEDALKKIMAHWKKIHTMCHNEWRNSHFAGIKKDIKEIEDKEGPQTKMFEKESDAA